MPTHNTNDKRNVKTRRDLGAMRNRYRSNKQMYWLFSPFLRCFHWIMVLCVVVLFITGLYIGDPNYGALPGSEPTFLIANLSSMSFIRLIHFSFGFLLIAALILRVYGYIRYKGDRLFPHFHKKSYWEGLIYSIKHYLFIPQEERAYLRNPLARTAYLSIYLALVLIIFTGLAMFAQVRPNSLLATLFNPVNILFTEYGTHLVHHTVAWYFIIFAIIHIYMAVRADYLERDGEISSMISGYKFYERTPEDIDDIDVEFAMREAEERRGKGLKRDAQTTPDELADPQSPAKAPSENIHAPQADDATVYVSSSTQKHGV